MGYRIVYIDCTNTVIRNKETGIERVVKNIIICIKKLNNLSDCHFIPVIAIGSEFYKLNPDNYKKGMFSKVLFNLLVSARNLLDKIFSKKRNKFISVDNFDYSCIDLHSKIVLIARNLIPYAFRIALKIDNVILSMSPVEFQYNDILFLPDSISNLHLHCSINHLNSNFPLIEFFVHDIIPIKYFGVCENSLHKNFRINYDLIVSKAASIICTTKTVMDEVIEYNNSLRSDLVYDYAYLGANFTNNKDINNIRYKTLMLFKNKSVYLMVGTIEPRKNHIYVINAFQTLWDNGFCGSLCIVGRLGWLYDEILERITQNRYFNKYLFFFSDINDDELAHCYEKSKALIFASIAEGFGLPLVEAMHYGKPVLISDIPVFREIGGDYPFFFSLQEADSLVNLIQQYESGLLNKQFKPREWITWDESIENLMKKVVALAETSVSQTQH